MHYYYTACDELSSEEVGSAWRHEMYGRWHAVKLRDLQTLCGRDDVHLLPDVEWPGAGPNLCPTCESAVLKARTEENDNPPMAFPGK